MVGMMWRMQNKGEAMRLYAIVRDSNDVVNDLYSLLSYGACSKRYAWICWFEEIATVVIYNFLIQ